MPTAARLALLTACILWAVSFVATKVALASAPPLTVVSARLVLSALCFVAWSAVAGTWSPRLSRRELVALAGLSLLGTGLHYGLQTIGLEYTTAANGSVWAVTGPITIAVFGVLVLKERLGPQRAGGILLALAGVLTVMGWQTVLAFDWHGTLLGDSLVLASIVLWGLFTVFGKALTDSLGALRMTAAVTVIGAAWMLPVAAAELAVTGRSLRAIAPAGWAAIAFLGVGCSFLATLLYFVALRRSEAQKVGVYLYTIPPMTAVVAATTLGEPLTPRFLLGSALVLAGVALTEHG